MPQVLHVTKLGPQKPLTSATIRNMPKVLPFSTPEDFDGDEVEDIPGLLEMISGYNPRLRSENDNA